MPLYLKSFSCSECNITGLPGIESGVTVRRYLASRLADTVNEATVTTASHLTIKRIQTRATIHPFLAVSPGCQSFLLVWDLNHITPNYSLPQHLHVRLLHLSGSLHHALGRQNNRDVLPLSDWAFLCMQPALIGSARREGNFSERKATSRRVPSACDQHYIWHDPCQLEFLEHQH